MNQIGPNINPLHRVFLQGASNFINPQKDSLTEERKLNRRQDYDRLRNLNQEQTPAYKNLIPQESRPPQMPNKTDLNLPGQSISKPQIKPQERHPALAKENSFDPAISEIKPNTIKVQDDFKNSINNKLNSDDPGVFTNALEELGSLEDDKLVPDTPAFEFKQKVTNQYAIGQDEEQGTIYQCPLTKTPCSRKTFWTRLKEFFQTLVGIQPKEEALTKVESLNKQDPISRSYTSNQQQVKAQNVSSTDAWKRPMRRQGGSWT